MNTEMFVAALNAGKFFAKIGGNGKVYLTMKDENGKSRFINREAKTIVDETGKKRVVVDENGKTIYHWVAGKELSLSQPQLPLQYKQ